MTRKVNNKYKGIFVPVEILERSDISSLEKFILAEVIHFRENGCYLGNSELARRFGVDRRSIIRAIARLTEKSLIKDVGKDCYHRKLFPKRQLIRQLSSPDCDKKSQLNKIDNKPDCDKTPQCTVTKVHSTAIPTVTLCHPKEHIESNIKEHKEKRGARATAKFIKPTLIQLKAKILEKGYSAVAAEVFFNHYESNGWRVGRNPMRSWPASLANWNIREKKGNNYGKKTGTTNHRRSFEQQPTAEAEIIKIC